MGYDNRGPKEMFDTVCDKCGKNCQVPFKPTSGKPIFCSDCFEKNDDRGGRDNRRGGRGGRDSRGGGRRDDRGGRGGRDSGWKDMFDAVCDSCGKDCEVPFKPTSGKPIYCSECFEGNDGEGAGGRVNNRQLEEKLSAMDEKLDDIIARLERLENKKTVRVEDEDKVSLK